MDFLIPRHIKNSPGQRQCNPIFLKETTMHCLPKMHRSEQWSLCRNRLMESAGQEVIPMKTYSQSLQNSKNLFDILSSALGSEHKKFSDITTILFEGYDKKVNYFCHEVPIGTFIKAAKEVPVSIEPYEENPASSWDTEYVWFCEQSVYYFYNRNYFQRLLFVADGWTLIPVVDDGFGDYWEVSSNHIPKRPIGNRKITEKELLEFFQGTRKEEN